jgi:glucose/arabinose dehydrogenase
MARRAAAVVVVAGALLAGCTGAPNTVPTAVPTGAQASSSASPTTTPAVGATTPAPGPTTTGLGVPTTGTVRYVPTVHVASVSDVATNLPVPWGIDFLPGGQAVVTLRDEARLILVGPDGTVTDVVGQGADEIHATTKPAGEGGLLGVSVLPGATAVSADLAIYQTTADDNRIVRATLSGSTLGPTRPILTGIPKGNIHNGGRLAVGPDGVLYVGTGETGDRRLAQNPSSLGGKVLRITPDGAPAPGNPDSSSPIWDTGHRNVEGIGFAPDGRVFASEFGQDTWDELNVLVPGGNYGWPAVEGMGGTSQGFIDPVAVWRTDEASPSGIAVTADAVYMAALRGERLWRIPLHPLAAGAAPTDPAGIGTPQVVLDGYGRMRAVVVAPDGSLWVLTNNTDGRGTPRAGDDRILRVTLG